ncbi:class IV adenylate cyclase [Candidatus Woesearchaeota archaeon]|nr:class IV adenylate cyclase [Candidatus Woesearchaeota archaeon]
MSNPTNQEVEVKILNINAEEIELKLKKLNAEKVKEVFQTNQYYTNPCATEKKAIRIRKENNKSWVTIKRKLAKKENGVRTREEIEEEISNPLAMENIFSGLGLTKERLYEIKRKYYYVNNCSVEIVHMATIPTYLEIEGSKEQIYRVAEKLGFSQDDFLKESFYKVYPQTKEHDMLFENE